MASTFAKVLARPSVRGASLLSALFALCACAAGTEDTVATPPSDTDDAGAESAGPGDADIPGDGPPDAAEAGHEACVPSCNGRQCGPDGCGSQCQPGCANGVACTAQGACEGGCSATFAVDLEGIDLASLAFDPPGSVLVAGKQATSGYVARLHACGGKLAGTSALDTAGFSETSIHAVTSTSNGILLGGRVVPTVASDLGDALLARVDATQFVPTWTGTIDGSDGADQINAMVIDGSGGLWAVGASGPTPHPWLLRAESPFTSPCATAVESLDGPGVAYALSIHPTTGDVFVTGQNADRAFVVSFDEGDCAVGMTCSDAPCAPKWSASFELGASYTVGRGVVAFGSYVFVAGYADVKEATPNDVFGFVVAISLATGNVAAEHTWDPTGKGDAYLGLASDGSGALFAHGARGWDGSDRYGAGTRSLVKLVAPTLEPAWRHDTQDERVALGVVLDGSDGILLASWTDSGSRVVRCTTAGLCP